MTAAGAGPRGLAHPQAVAERRAMLAAPHAAPLARYVETLRGPGCEVPDLDPADGGVGARLLFVFEKPGQMTSPARHGRPGSGFVSRDNDDPTAAATWSFMRQAGIDRRETAIWNVVPRWNGTTRLTAAERGEGLDRLAELLPLMPRLNGVVLVGRQAERARGLFEQRGLRCWISAHPSGQVRAAYPERWQGIGTAWAAAAASLGS